MNLLSLCQAAFPRSILPGTLVYNLLDSAAALMLALREEPFVAIEQEESAAETLARDIRFYRALFSRNQTGKTLFVPDPGGAEEAGQRAKILSLLADDDSIVTSERNLVSAFWDRAQLSSGLPVLGRGVHMERAALEDALAGFGYRRVPMVASPGDYSVRGWIFDLFSPAEANPVRVEFFGDEIERLDFFDIETQLSVSVAESAVVYPAREGDVERDLLACTGGRDVFSFVRPEENETFSERAVFLSRFSFAAEDAPEGESAAGQMIETGLRTLRGMGICRDERRGFDEIPSAIRAVSHDHRVILVASSEGQAERIRDIFHEQDMMIARMELADAGQTTVPVSLVVGSLSAGLFLPGLLILTERELFGERPKHRPIRKSRVANLLAALDDIEPGDYVVHRDHGIGKFSGTVRRPSGDAEVELMQIEYEDGRVYLPIQNIGVLGKYRAEEGIIPRVDRVGGKTWQRKKERARKKVNELADRLLALYADRSQKRGFRFSADTALHHEFEGFFPYDETEDQIAAITAIKEDMESDRPMDRLLCGDVGYGKTEVAMRAAFKAVYDGRQVAVLVPTTILAEQHFRTFTERFSGFPVMIDFLSRFKTGKESAAVLRRVAAGETDIVIGTHALLSRRVSFGRLGLLIVDEEHRFGVAQKERFKELSSGVDVLTLTATPIPRSLHMGLSGIRGISVIETPPEERLAVRTVVTPYRDDIVQEAIIYEMMRQGQVFFVHNRIGDIRRVAENITRLVPEARLAVAHGQMAARELEAIMRRFFTGELDVLVSTAIVGAGLDVPQANTIIIDGAERMGLADLYQLRGRVGRSSRKGHAYFIIPPETSMTDQAKRRIQAIREMSYLGAGFRLAMRDLEIRGAGNVFGPEQSGHIHEIGFDLYIEMLEQAVAERKGEPIREEREPAIELAMSAFIPEEYVEDPTLRMSLYRRISSLRDGNAIAGLQDELHDRFGTVPDEVRSLLEIVGLKVLARGLSVERVRERGGEVSVLFSPDTQVQPQQLFGLAEGRKGNVKFLPNGFSLNVRKIQRDRITVELQSMLGQLAEEVKP